ncbi:MAG: [acyl-carrier-protein] S-malonyltransferase [Thermotogota bacterium]|nr:[acyl-carrier-protein] S-malonyltransferase [Thermotogota bacterium]MDK2864450.1 [acyl-carrier-protein] S-malonyltransferase [Thermotogota bacterium]
MTAWLFPGQGSQSVGMGKVFIEKYSDLVDQACEALGFDLKTLILEGPEEDLRKTENTQPAIFLVSYLAARELLEKEKPSFLAGHSLGEYTALAVAEVFDFTTGIKLVRKRGELMSEARSGTMAAIIGLDKETIEKLISKVDGTVVLANENSPQQFVISGEMGAVKKACSLLEEAGARRVTLLNVSGAFHSPLMEEAKKKMQEVLSEVDFNPPRFPVVQNVVAKSVDDPQEIKKNLIEQMTGRVRWIETLEYLHDAGVKRFVEVGPGKVLTGLVRKTLKGVEVEQFG